MDTRNIGSGPSTCVADRRRCKLRGLKEGFVQVFTRGCPAVAFLLGWDYTNLNSRAFPSLSAANLPLIQNLVNRQNLPNRTYVAHNIDQIFPETCHTYPSECDIIDL